MNSSTRYDQLADGIAERSSHLAALRRPAEPESSQPVVLAPSWTLVPGADGGLALLRDHEVVVEGDHIAQVRPARGSVDRRIDLSGQLLVPGLISMHSHAAGGAATRGYVEGNLTPMSRVPNPRVGRQFLHAMVMLDELSTEDLDVCPR